MTYGRALAIGRAKHPVIYSQDDDIIHSPRTSPRSSPSTSPVS
jgi:hypothetical protein